MELTTTCSGGRFTTAKPRSARRRRADSAAVARAGFTLVELLIVLLALAIVGIVALPQFSNMGRESTIRLATVEFVSALEYARGLAATHGRSFAVETEPASNVFRVLDVASRSVSVSQPAADPPLAPGGVVYHPLDKRPYDMRFDSLRSYRGVRIGRASAREVRFYPDGHASETTQVVYIEYSGMARAVAVDGATGRVSVQ